MTTCPNCGRPCRGTCGICCVTRSREQMRERARVAEILRGAAEAKQSPAKPSPAVSRLVELAAVRAQGARYGYQGAINADRR